MRARVLISAPYMVPVVDRFRAELEAAGLEVVVADVEERLSEEELLLYVGDIDGIICGDDRITARVLAGAPHLKVISKWGTGTDSIDRATAAELGITVCNTPDAFSLPVADTTLGYMLCFARNLVRMTLRMRAGEWHKTPGFALHEKTLGIIGVGHVGRAVGRLARAFGMRVLGADPVAPPPDFVLHTTIEMVDLDTLLRESDFVSVHCDLNPTSYHLLDDRAFGVLKPGAIIINTARGPVVDEVALLRALQSGRAGGAALDVFEAEPLPADSPLREMENVLLAPHNANSSPSAWEHVHRNTIDNLLRELRTAGNRR
jgi:phosphoglycerate dehydrogenase-like enzyme